MTAHATHRMHANSMDTWKHIDPGPREKMILDCCRKSYVPLSDREIADRLGFQDLNCVRPRISGLIEKGLLIVAGTITDAITGRKTRVCTNATIF